MPRFPLTQLVGDRGVLMGDEAHHLLRVHRVKPGETIEVTHAGISYSAIVGEMAPGSVAVDIAKELASVESTLRVDLMPAILKGDKLELVIQKAVELGVSSVVPLYCSRSIVPLDKAASRVPRYGKIAREAAKQSGRSAAPTIIEPQLFTDGVASCGARLKLMAYEGGGVSLWETLSQVRDIRHVALLVGPEGGFTIAEVAAAAEAGFIPVGLGPRILRAETASLALLSIIMYHLGDVR